MNDDYVAQRRAYVKEIRSSFANSTNSRMAKSADNLSLTHSRADILSRMRNGTDSLARAGLAAQSDTDGEEPIGAFAMFKVKFLLCIFLFAAFVICDRTGVDFFRMSSDTIYEKVSENYDYTNLKKYVMMVSDFDKK